VSVGVVPEAAISGERIYGASAVPGTHGTRYLARVDFPHGGRWQLRVLIESATGSGELRTIVEPTPAGTIGPIGLLVYSFPFLAIGMLWGTAILRERVKLSTLPAESKR
jgi:hypothetical protein